MAEKELKSIKFPGLEDVYKVPQGGGGCGGTDGYSPVAKVEETADGAKITITDKTGTTEATVKNGKDGKDGSDGAPGKDGKDGTDGAPGKDGSNGITPTIGTNGNWYLGDEDTDKPSRGPAGQDGAPGAAGHTPEITAEKSGKVTTIKADGTAIAEISDGSDGAPGKDGAGMDINGAAAGQIAKISAVDENGVPTAWTPVDMPSGGGEKPLSLIVSYDFTDNTASAFQETGLDGLTELIFLSTSITNGTTVDSGLTLTINDVPIAAMLVPIYKQGTNTSEAGEPWEVCRYNGAFWECLLCNKKSGSSAITTASSQAILNNRAIRDVGPAAKIKLHVPNPLYKPVAGALEVWGR